MAFIKIFAEFFSLLFCFRLKFITYLSLKQTVYVMSLGPLLFWGGWAPGSRAENPFFLGPLAMQFVHRVWDLSHTLYVYDYLFKKYSWTAVF